MKYDIIDDAAIETGSLNLTAEGKQNLLISRGWAMFLAIMGFISLGLLFLLAFVMFAAGSAIKSSSGINGVVIGIAYLVSAGIGLAPIIFLFKFAKQAGIACRQSDNNAFNIAIKNLRSLFKSYGIIIISLFGIYIIAMIVLLIIGVGNIFPR